VCRVGNVILNPFNAGDGLIWETRGIRNLFSGLSGQKEKEKNGSAKDYGKNEQGF
jgi:hypothetical protein